VRSRIRVLPGELVEKIAAGEVVERPASVVKELVENSIDAGATRILVYVKGSGVEQIRVVDNGVGMNEEELKLAFQRHATSKIKDEQDLERITTLGFRGEALPSIAAVSRVEVLSRPAKEVVGARIVIEGGNILSLEPAGCPAGTSVDVRNLFFNTPARRKFLGSERQEFGRIMGVVERYALIYEKVHFKLFHNGKMVFDVPPGKLEDRIAALWGRDVAKAMVPIHSDGVVKLKGMVSKPHLTRKDKNRIATYVNGRYVKNASLVSYILEGYGTLLFRDSYPYAVVMIDVLPEMVDVNVHPSKYLVKFRDEQAVRRALKDVIWTTLTSQDNIPSAPAKETKNHRVPLTEVRKQRQVQFEVEKPKGKSIFDYIAKSRVPGMSVLGQFDDTYIILKSKDAIIIVDQHAAHERIRYERFLRDIKDRRIQELIEPVIIHLGIRDYNDLLSIKKELAELCLVIEDMGNGTVVVRGVPPLLKRDEVESIIRGIIDLGAKYIDRKRDEFIKLISCKGAIKAHEKLSIYEMEELVSQLLKCENPYTCPHGRPTMIKFTTADLEKMFKRNE